MCTQPDVRSKCCRAAVLCSGVCLCKASLSLVKAPAKEQHLLLIPSLFCQEASGRGCTCCAAGDTGNSQC